MISGLTLLDRPKELCYPYLESIRSFLPVVDEMVVMMNPYNKNYKERREEILGLSLKVRVVTGIFDLQNIGWASYGIMRTTGYQACRGDIVLMYDADGILHENDYDRLQERMEWFGDESRCGNKVRGYWLKRRIYTKTRYWPQYKHSGIYNKSRTGDRLDFYDPNGRGIPNYNYLNETEKSVQFPIQLWGYEHVWDTMDVIVQRVTNYGKMLARQKKHELKTPEQYFEEYRTKLIDNLKTRGKDMNLDEHPAIIKGKLAQVGPEHFSYNFFEDARK